MTDTNNPVKALLLTKAKTLRALADDFEAQANALPAAEETDPLLDVDQVMAEFGVGRDSLKAAAERGEIELLRGARGKLLIARSAVRTWIESRPVQPRPRKTASAADLVAWEDEANAQLRALQGGRR